jgi:hypothetical protein
MGAERSDGGDGNWRGPPRPRVLRPGSSRRAHHDRSRAELIIRELKAAYALNKIPMQDFGGNEASFQLVLLAYNLLSWFKRLCAPPSLQRATLLRLRRQLFLAPAHLTRPQGRPVLRLAHAYPFPDLFRDTRRRIQRVQPAVLNGRNEHFSRISQGAP